MNRVILGVLLIVVGALALSGYFFGNVQALAVYWPVLLILYGITLLQTDRTAYAVGMMVVGFVLLADNMLPLIPIAKISDFWPVLVIIVGVLMILGIAQRKDTSAETAGARTDTRAAGYTVEARGRVVSAVITDEGDSDEIANAAKPAEEPAPPVGKRDETTPPESAFAAESDAAEVESEMRHKGDTAGGAEMNQGKTSATYEDGRGHFLAELPEGVEAVEYELNIGAGVLKIGGATDNLIEIDTDRGSSEPRFELKLLERAGRRIAHLRVNAEHMSSRLPILAGTVWEVKLNRNLPLALDLEANAANCQLNLAELTVGEVHLENNAARTTVMLGERAKDVKVQFENNAAKLEVQAPGKFAFDAEVRNHLGNHNLTSFSVRREADHYISQDYETSEFKLTLKGTNNVANLELELV